MAVKKTSAKHRRIYAFSLLRKVVLKRDIYCQMHGDCEGSLEAAHIISKQMGGARLSVAFEPDNVVLLCQKHHRLFDGVFDKWTWAEKRLGSERWAELQEQGQQRFHRDYDKVVAELRRLLEEAA